ncbi:hypothetical protein BPNPMPFG_006323 [Mesorhizobium sp. AR07]|uniref:hypothetical protein n=1 Tax=Mesorhizobium sp. AR07 TaxID=2865838 RepID=UPI002160D076|nr:hypothetical protein [Mesorhizobium sp. AR07]UVK44405.1 hypothetical protein BPNPMPFG_006323 [Mesorhizobium sp. AR07]
MFIAAGAIGLAFGHLEFFAHDRLLKPIATHFGRRKVAADNSIQTLPALAT